MGYITAAIAQIGKGEPEEAIRVFDLAFWNCNPNESDLLLLIKVVHKYQAFDKTKHLRPLDHHHFHDREI